MENTPLEQIHESHTHLTGAQLAEEPIFEQTLITQDELPMVIWLRGDEPYVQDFCIDAEGAMAELGIKRSRLTQISGKELRVGRIRVDRYTRPMYRKVDIETYKQWSRATATHLRSSSVIKEAATKLEEHTQLLSDSFVDTLAAYNAKLEKNLEDLRVEITDIEANILTTNQEWLTQLKQEQATQIHTVQDDLNARFDESAHNADLLKNAVAPVANLNLLATEFRASFDVLSAASQAVSDMLTQQIEKTREANEAQNAFNRDIGKALSLIIQFQREASKKQEEFAIQLKKLDAVAVIEEQVRKPKRKVPVLQRRWRRSGE